MKCTVVLIALLMCCTKLVAQSGASYPDVQTLRTALLTLATEQQSAFQKIKGTLRYKKGTVAYYNASVHIVKADTPKIAEDTNPLQAYYMNFLAKEMSEAQSKVVYAKWQELMLAALPGYTKQLAGNQYPDLESMNFTSPDGRTKFTLYRNGSGAACQVSVSIINSNINELITAVTDNQDKTTPANNKPATTGNNAINKEEFSRQLKQLLGLAKTSFKSIKGAEENTRFIKTFRTDYIIAGAGKAVVRDEDVSMNYLAEYGNDKNSSEGDALFEQLHMLVSDAIPATFVKRGVVVKDGNKTVEFADKTNKQKLTIRKSDYSASKTHYTVTLAVEQYSYWLD